MFRTLLLTATAGLALLFSNAARAQGSMDVQASPNPVFAGASFTVTARVFGPATGAGTFRFRACLMNEPCGPEFEVVACTGSQDSGPPPTKSCTLSRPVGTYDITVYYEGEPTAMPPPTGVRVQ